jgi:hypothetical protein
MTRIFSAGVATILISLCSTALNAAHPFNTDDAGVVAHNSFEVEVSSGYSKEKIDTADYTFKYGLKGSFDIGFSGGIGFFEKNAIMSSPSVSLKLAFIPDHFTLSASSSFAENDFSVSAIFSHSSGIADFHANAGIGPDEKGEPLLIYSASLVKDAGPVNAGIEIFGDHGSDPLWNTGLIYPLTDHVSISAGAGGDLEFSSLVYTAGITITLSNNEDQ